MSELTLQALAIVGATFEIVGAAALVVGFVAATARFLRQVGSTGALAAFDRYRQSIGRVVVLGLEVIVASTIIKTITVDPTPRGLGLLVLIVAIRTALSWTMVLEMNGRWPWQKAPAKAS